MSETDGAISRSRVDKAPLFLESWNGVVKRLENLYSAASLVAGKRNVQILPVANPAALRQMLQAQERSLELPIVGVTPTNVDPNEGHVNASVARKHGIPFALDESKSFWYVLKARPVVITFQVTIVTDDVVTLMNMVDRWESNEIWGFTLEVPDSSIKVKVRVTPDKSLSVPPIAAAVDGSNQFELTTNLKVETHAGFIWRIPAVRAIEMSVGIPKTSIADVLADPTSGIEVTNVSITKVDLDSPATMRPV